MSTIFASSFLHVLSRARLLAAQIFVNKIASHHQDSRPHLQQSGDPRLTNKECFQKSMSMISDSPGLVFWSLCKGSKSLLTNAQFIPVGIANQRVMITHYSTSRCTVRWKKTPYSFPCQTCPVQRDLSHSLGYNFQRKGFLAFWNWLCKDCLMFSCVSCIQTH